MVVLSLSIGIGANTALFTMVDAAYLRKLSVDKPDELVFFRWTSGPSARPFQPSLMDGNSVMVGAVTLLASYQPLRRASRIDPTIALRCD